MFHRILAPSVTLVALLAAAPALAQAVAPPAAEASAAEGASPGDGAAAPGADGAAGKSAEPQLDAGSSAVEEEGKTYRFVGLRYRHIIVPAFMMRLFGDGGTTVNVPSFGPEFIIRRNDFEYGLALTYADYGMDPTPFKASSDGEDAWEIVESKLNIIYATSDFIWTTQFSPEVGLNYGMGVGLGVVFGKLHRVQAYSPTGAPTNPSNYRPCVGVGVPNIGNYCGDDNEHYGSYTEPNWLDGGSKPVIFPWFALQTGLRFKPAKNFAAHLDLGFSTSGPFFGLGADYGL